MTGWLDLKPRATLFSDEAEVPEVHPVRVLRGHGRNLPTYGEQSPPVYLLRSWLHHKGAHLSSCSIPLAHPLSSPRSGDTEWQTCHAGQTWTPRWYILRKELFSITLPGCVQLPTSFQNPAYLTNSPASSASVAFTIHEGSTSQKNVQFYKHKIWSPSYFLYAVFPASSSSDNILPYIICTNFSKFTSHTFSGKIH